MYRDEADAKMIISLSYTHTQHSADQARLKAGNNARVCVWV